MALPRILWSWLRRVQDDPFTEQGEAGTAIHLAFDHLDLVDGALDLAGAPGEGEPVGDGLLVVADAGGEGAQVGLAVVGFYGGEPCFQVLAAGPPGHHLGEAADVTGQGLDVRAAFLDLAELFLLFWAQVIGAGQQPAGDLAGFRHGWARLGGGGGPPGPAPPRRGAAGGSRRSVPGCGRPAAVPGRTRPGIHPA